MTEFGENEKPFQKLLVDGIPKLKRFALAIIIKSETQEYMCRRETYLKELKHLQPEAAL